MDKVYNYLLNDMGFENNDILIAAISGGPDSMALLDILLKVSKKINVTIICAHVNHNTGRVGQQEEQEYVKSFCQDNHIIFEGMAIENYGHDNFENEARLKRYNYFETLVKKYRAKYLFTAHHGDDLMETILMRIVRGSTLKGYSGFSKIVDRGNYKIVRPFIEITKQELIEYNETNKIKYFIDNTNFDDVHTRNRYRKYIIPKLKSEDENVHEKFYKFSKILLEYSDYIDKDVNAILSSVYKKDILDIHEFLKLDKLIAIKIIYKILENIYENKLSLITNKHIDLIFGLINSKKVNTYVYLPNNIKAIKEYNTLRFTKNILKNNGYELEITNCVNLPNNHIIQFIDASDKTGNDICYLNSKEIKLPLKVRTRKDGDKIYVKNMIGRKKVNDIFIDCKIKVSDRDMWPIVIDSNNEIIWIPNLKKSKFDKTKEQNYDIILRYY